ncbi:MAG: CpsB/CapC family capsule biosynthesis tyrosine phosphatase [Candidatus Fimenecus sp.]
MFADIHIHALYGVDDGPVLPAQMEEMITAACESGTRLFCMTPHCSPLYFGDNRRKIDSAFLYLRYWVQQKYPDVQLYLGNELRFNDAAPQWLAEGVCKTLGGTKYVLVDFSASESEKSIIHGLDVLLNAGYLPILAHTERYKSLQNRFSQLNALRNDGVTFQVNAASVTGHYGLGDMFRSRKLLSKGFVDYISSDAHGLKKRSPDISVCYRYITKHGGQGYADRLCCYNAMRIFGVNSIVEKENMEQNETKR